MTPILAFVFVHITSALVAASCPLGWQSFGEFCYVGFPGVSRTYLEAYLVCSRNSMGNLASILSKEEEDFIDNVVLEETFGSAEKWWIGLSRGLTCGSNNEYTWSDFSIVEYLNWAENRTNENTTEQCVSFKRGVGLEPTDCNAKIATICKQKASGTRVCNSSANLIGEKCVQEFSTNLTQPQAEMDCNARGGNLLSIHTLFEQSVVQEYFTMRSLSKSFWIGLRGDDAKGEFVWTDMSEVNYVNWNTLEPDEADLKNVGALLTLDDGLGEWFDASDQMKRPYLCQFDLLGNCSLTCPTGFVRNNCGVKLCQCKDPCKDVVCESFEVCKEGRCVGPVCPVCECKTCKTGYVIDRDGCQTCRCKDPKCERVKCEKGCTCISGHCCPNSVLSQKCDDPCADYNCGYFKVCK
ncbi:C-type mannose receptor 2-like isoform X2 [Liolophura sinensis]